MEGPEAGEREELIADFCGVTGAHPEQATTELEAANWTLEDAITAWFERHGYDDESGSIPDPTPAQSSSTARDSGGARTLGGAPAPESSAASSSRSAKGSQAKAGSSKMRTLKDLQGDSGGQSHGDGEDSEDDQDFFAGGEKSGLAVQNPGNPRDKINSILNRAKKNVARPGGDDPEPRTSHFTGTGQTLGGDDTPSQIVQGPSPTRPRPPLQTVERVLHFWLDGFSVDDGPLFRYDDPANAQTLDMINSGRAPLNLLDVQPGQPVDVKIDQHREENYRPQPKKYKPFSGAGQRLGSPTPGIVTAASSSSAPAPSTTATNQAPTVAVDDSQPVITLQIRLGDGTRLQARFNTSHTVGDVYEFVDRANSSGSQRPYALMTTFPSRELSDRSVVLGDMAEFKRGGVMVQKWT